MSGQIDLSYVLQDLFEKGFTHPEIQGLLGKKYNIKLSITTVKRKLHALDLKRKNFKESSLELIVAAVIDELYSCGYNIGYRSMWQKLLQCYHLRVKRETVYDILKLADPESVANRLGNKLIRREYLSPGPNLLCHLDGYDKLKRFGFAIHGCVDGFSRYILWLRVADSNNDQRIISHYYLETIKKLKFLPTIIRSDKGTENTDVEKIQKALRSSHEDKFSSTSFIKGKSTQNQRIESYWGRMRKHSMDFYIQLFKKLEQAGDFDGSSIHVSCLRYCFGRMIENDLDCTKLLWNNHKVRKQAAHNNVSGRPVIMYELPCKFNALDYQKEVNIPDIDILLEECTAVPKLINPIFEKLAKELLPSHDIPATVEEALILYKDLLTGLTEMQL